MPIRYNFFMNPVIKWPGGKRREIKYVENMIPKNTLRIVEPFFGGGAFSLNFIDDYEIIGSDIDTDLVNFYSKLSSPIFKKKLKTIATWWDLNEEINELDYQSIIDFLPEKKYPTVKHTFYYAARNYYNHLKLNDEYNIDRALMFYIMRELSFSSMFRFNASGEFNVPYGGYAYNKKSMIAKYNMVLELSKRKFNIELSDFINVIEREKHNKNNLIFLDPPYDSPFSDYNSNSFGRNDQIRLRDSLMNSTASIMMIINETDFIRNLYDRPEFKITSFDKQYSVNFKNRNNQKVKHLIITNY